MDEDRRRQELGSAAFWDAADVTDDLKRLQVLRECEERWDLRQEQLRLRLVLRTDVH